VLEAVEQRQEAQQMFELQQNNAKWEHDVIYEKLRWEAATTSLIKECDAHNATHTILRDEQHAAEERFKKQTSDFLSLQDNNH
jgi:hypothetical protein